MLKLRSLKFLAVLASIGALVVLGTTQTASLASKETDASLATVPCSGPSKVFTLGMAHQGADRVTALKMRIAPEVTLQQLRFDPQPDEILFNRNGLMEMRFSQSVLMTATQINVEVCNASIAHDVREANWIMKTAGQLVAQMIGADNIRWSWRENGEKLIPGTELSSKELSCTGQALVQPFQVVSRQQPLCVKDMADLSELTERMAKIGQEQSSFLGKVQTLLFGTQKFDEQISKLNAEMAGMYLYSPYDGIVQGITQDSLNGLTWIKMQVEESSQILVAE